MTLLLLLGAGGGYTISAETGGFTVLDPLDATHPEFTRWTETDSQILRRGILGDGVTSYGAGLVSAQATPNLSVNVAGGTGKQSGSAVTIGGATLPIPTPDPDSPRIDLVGFDGNGSLVLTAGSPAANPYPPDVPSGVTALALVYVEAASTQIRSSDLVDKRILRAS